MDIIKIPKQSKGLSYEDMTDKTKDFYNNYCRDGLLVPMEQLVKRHTKIKAWSVEMNCEVIVNTRSIQRGNWVSVLSVIDTTNYIINQFKNIHGDKYDYQKVNYKGRHTKVIIICKVHGKFKQTSGSHLVGRGCPKCKGCKFALRLKSNTNEFLKRVKNIHGDKYDYSKVDYIGCNNKIIISCNIDGHEDFYQTPSSHLVGMGCPKCGIISRSDIRRSNTEEFIEKSVIKHGDKYDYSKVDYEDSSKKVHIICKIHGEFKQKPNSHLNGTGCPVCAGTMKSNTDEFIEKSMEVHVNKYDYSKVDYKGAIIKVVIICKIHGEFRQIPNSHLNGTGCPICRTSHGERSIWKYLKKNTILFNRQKRFKNCINKRPLPFDFYLEKHNLCIEYDGSQHYNIYPKWGGEKKFNQIQLHDKIKTDYCRENGINLLRIPYTEIDNINEILDNYLNKFFVPLFI
jgi:very-short-patch-repair endonuclease